MSFFATLAYAIAAAVRPRTPDVEITELKAQVDDLKRQVSDLNHDLANMRIIHAPIEMHTRAQAQQCQALMNVQGRQYIMQNFNQALDDYVRNCTPGRHELFLEPKIKARSSVAAPGS